MPKSSEAPAPDVPVIVCRNVTKRFYLYQHRTTTLQEMFVRLVLRRPIHIRQSRFEVRGLDLTIHGGESVGIIGQNGSGKSTTLRLMTGIYPPTSGTIERHGRLVAVIGLGATFHSELTGAENIGLYGAALGMSREEIATHVQEIVAFAELGAFIDVPIKYYSSGMQARLAFSVALCASPDVLLLDEVLAVGDEQFSHRSLERIRNFHRNGGTIVFVSHDLESVRRLCTRAVWMDQGQVRMQGPVNEVVNAYLAAQR